MRIALRLGLALALLALAACQTQTPTLSTPTSKTAAPVATGKSAMRALKFKEIQRLFSDKSFSAANEPLSGKHADDRWARAVTYLRDDTNRAYRYYPNWTKTGQDYYALGALVKGKQKKPIMIDGVLFKNSDTFCLTDELSRNSSSCEMVFSENGRYYLNGKRNSEIVISQGYDGLMGPLVKRAVEDNNNKLLWALAGDFKRLEPDLVAKFNKADNNVFIASVRREHKIKQENARIAAANKAKADMAAAARRKAAEARRQASCKAKTGKPCAPSNGGLIGAALGGLISAVEGAGSSSSSHSGGATYTPKNKYTVQCRERVLMDVDTFKKGPSFTCTGEVYKCEEQFKQQLKSRYGGLDKTCAASFGRSYTFEGLNRDTAY